ncbi:hypothetical protein [Cellvibrio japonicus]|uniref:Lipoprotein n=1 Tax=Cellvibrio japonicus (strain Ueda107) TaxID=498211 RepID=B3PJ73_CELJU|nr:hypothetical protein [Cellvibrio japonicus]ACE85069.1 hypothetical protein CJA_2185 [Cellvibrio japonicus Ueda107]QEI12631.1 hypothetical protein FY117_10600 [Cellvibrio japonicus]QEI16205.1 hypothetical protein FY116_10605 [Cellvibrio japonicus]QEI19783.1 hypothetical protein FY115_10600 [Cellvibrio japonicus]
MNISVSHSALLAMVLILSACTTPVAPLDETRLPQVAEKILQETLYYNSLFTQCARLGGDNELEALEKQQDWLASNWQLAAAADNLYSQQHANYTFNYKTQKLVPAALLLNQKTRQRAQDELSLEKRTLSNQQKTCSFRLKQMTAENMRLNSDHEIALYEQALLNQATVNTHEVYDLPSLAGGIATDLAPGRSYFPIAHQHEGTCDQPYTLIVDNEWPQEAYINFCSDLAVELLTCEWGNCQSTSL